MTQQKNIWLSAIVIIIIIILAGIYWAESTKAPAEDKDVPAVVKKTVNTEKKPTDIAYVAFGESNKIGVIDLKNFILANVLPASNNPHGVALANGYIFTSSSKMGKNEMMMEPDHNNKKPIDIKKMMSLGSDIISVVDPQKRELVKEINVGGGSHHMASTPDGTKVFATIPSLSGIAVIDTKSLEKTNFIKTGKIYFPARFL